jgi:hypothetical protein
MHPDVGMGVELTQKTQEQRDHVEKFIHSLMGAENALPELLVEPEGLDGENSAPQANIRRPGEVEDPLLELFQCKASLPAELFLNELRKQRRTQHTDAPEETILPV